MPVKSSDNFSVGLCTFFWLIYRNFLHLNPSPLSDIRIFQIASVFPTLDLKVPREAHLAFLGGPAGLRGRKERRKRTGNREGAGDWQPGGREWTEDPEAVMYSAVMLLFDGTGPSSGLQDDRGVGT